MKESRDELAAAMLSHGLRLLAHRPFDLELEMDGKPYHAKHTTAGDFRLVYTKPQHGGGFELFDIFSKGKQLAMRTEDSITDWRIVSMKRGDWESAFLLTLGECT